MASLSGYGKTIAASLRQPHCVGVHRSEDSRVVILEYEVHGKILSQAVRPMTTGSFQLSQL